MSVLSIIFFSFIETIQQLHYDHMVLIDYLISRDVGVLCAQYLLRLVPILHFLTIFADVFRWNKVSFELWPLTSLTHLHMCLRLVSQSWHAFVDDSVYSTKIEKLNCKRQRISGDKDSNRASSSSQFNYHWYACFSSSEADSFPNIVWLKFVIVQFFFAAYYRGAMGILLVYDVTDESSFNSTDPCVT